MIRPVVLVWLSAAVGMILAGEVHAQLSVLINNPKSVPQRPVEVKRNIPKVTIDPGEKKILLKVLATGVKDAESQPDPQQRINALTNMSCGQLLLGDLSAAKATLDTAKATIPDLPGEQTKTLAWLAMAERLGEYGETNEARAAAFSAVSLMNSLDTINRIMVARSLAQAQAIIGEEVGAKSPLEVALDALTKMTNEAQWQQSLTMTVQGFIEVGDFERALDIGEAIPEIRSHLKKSVVSQVARAIPKAARELKLRVLDRCLVIAKGIEDHDMRSEALSSIAIAQAETGDLAGAVVIAGDLTKKPLDPAIGHFTVPIYVAIASAQYRAGDKAKGKATFAEAVGLARRITPDKANLRAKQLNSIAATQAKLGEFAEATKTAEEINEDNYYKSLAFSEIGHARITAKDNAGANADFRRAFDLAKTIHGEPNLNLGNVLITQQQALYEVACGLAKARDFDEANKVAKYALERDPSHQFYHTRYAFSQLAVERARAGDVEGALRAAGQIEDEWSRGNAYEQIAKLEAEAGAETHACAWIAKLDDPQLRTRLIWSVVDGLAKRSTNPDKDLPDLSKLKKQGAAK